jgi:hypothetical protein
MLELCGNERSPEVFFTVVTPQPPTDGTLQSSARALGKPNGSKKSGIRSDPTHIAMVESGRPSFPVITDFS